ncbi:MAG TPA: hypothetical protein VIC61_08045 [Gammaproteobacteria bacterium]|jgi:hypothetical protein
MFAKDADPELLAGLQGEFEDYVTRQSREDLSRCIRLLGMYVALYKVHHGDLPESQFAALFDAGSANGNVLRILLGGLREANAMLGMLETDRGSVSPPAAVAPVRLN